MVRTRIAGRAAGDDDVVSGEVLRRRRACDGGDDGLLGGDFGFAFFDSGVGEFDVPLFDSGDCVQDSWMVVHRLVHRGGDDHWHAGSEGGRGGGRHGGVVDCAGDLADRVGGGGGDQEDIGPPLAAAELDVFDAARDFRYDVVFCGELDRPGVDDSLGAGAHHRADRRTLAAEFVGEFDGFHRGDASCDAECDVNPLKHSFVVTCGV